MDSQPTTTNFIFQPFFHTLQVSFAAIQNDIQQASYLYRDSSPIQEIYDNHCELFSTLLRLYVTRGVAIDELIISMPPDQQDCLCQQIIHFYKCAVGIHHILQHAPRSSSLPGAAGIDTRFANVYSAIMRLYEQLTTWWQCCPQPNPCNDLNLWATYVWNGNIPPSFNPALWEGLVSEFLQLRQKWLAIVPGLFLQVMEMERERDSRASTPDRSPSLTFPASSAPPSPSATRAPSSSPPFAAYNGTLPYAAAIEEAMRRSALENPPSPGLQQMSPLQQSPSPPAVSSSPTLSPGTRAWSVGPSQAPTRSPVLRFNSPAGQYQFARDSPQEQRMLEAALAASLALSSPLRTRLSRSPSPPRSSPP